MPPTASTSFRNPEKSISTTWLTGTPVTAAGLDRERRPTPRVGDVDLVRADAGDVDLQVARDGERGDQVPTRVDADQLQRVRQAVAVASHDEDRRGLREQQPGLLIETHGPTGAGRG